jgi:putative ABC transport system permease protein
MMNFFKARTIAVDFGMFEMMKIEVVKGRSLDQKYASDTIASVVINETAQKLMNMKEPIGKELIIKQRKLKIIELLKILIY